MAETNHKKQCLKILHQICKELDEDLNTPFCKKVQHHIQQCPQCNNYVESIKDTVHFCQKLFDEDVPQAVEERLWEFLKLNKPQI